MTTHVTGPAAVAAAAPTLHLASYRRNSLVVVTGGPLFTTIKQACTTAVFLLGRLYAKAYLHTGQQLGTDGQVTGFAPLAA